jgi:dihydrofolate synthase / folylpolyglutamate synthase
VDYPDSVQFLYALGNEIKTAKLGLERIRAVLAALGDPQKSFRSVHVAGTNGKGSTCAMVEAGLRAAGVRTGLYTSPHLIEPLERIQVDGLPVSREQFTRAFDRVHEAAMRLDLDCHPTYFETVTAMGFWLFRELEVETTVVETGLGGRLDATNVIQPAVTAITAIDFDHEAHLGHTIEAIAGEKAGILKPGVPAVFARQRPDAEVVLEARARELGVRLARAADFEIRDLEIDARGCSFNGLRCPLAGEHQVDNAITAVLVLGELGVAPEGIADARWPGRLECVSPNPDVILDGAHNPAGARALRRYLERFYAGRKLWMIYGTMRDKAVEEIAEILFPLAQELILTAPDAPRAVRPEALRELAGRGRVAADFTSALEIVNAGVAADDVVVATGSLFLIGEARVAYSKCRGQLWDTAVW